MSAKVIAVLLAVVMLLAALPISAAETAWNIDTLELFTLYKSTMTYYASSTSGYDGTSLAEGTRGLYIHSDEWAADMTYTIALDVKARYGVYSYDDPDEYENGAYWKYEYWMESLTNAANCNGKVTMSTEITDAQQKASDGEYLKNYILFTSEINEYGENEIRITFNTGSSTWGTVLPEAYLYFFSLSKSAVDSFDANIARFMVSAYYDPNGTYYEEAVGNALERIEQNQQTQLEQDAEFYSNAEDIIAAALQRESDREKEEAGTSGEDNVGEALDVLNKVIDVASIKDAVAPLVEACGYEGTDSIWTLPSIVLPAIPGVMDEIALNEPISFDMSYYVNEYIPEDLLKLVQYVLTMGLIVYAVREIFSFIREVFGSG